jgi:hypothetical protein
MVLGISNRGTTVLNQKGLFQYILAAILVLTSVGHIHPGAALRTTLAQDISSQAYTYLQQREIPQPTKNQLNLFFAQEPIIKNLSKVYRNADPELAHRVLKKHGFVFLGDKFHVFMIKQFPGYVFKMALPWDDRPEWLNASRIWYADTIRDTVVQRNLKIKVPRKWTYFMPLGIWERDVPAMLVVAEYMDLRNGQPLSHELKKTISQLTSHTGFSDDHEDNIVECNGYAVILDTEERKYSKKPDVPWYEKIRIYASDVLDGFVARANRMAGAIGLLP